MKPEPKPEAPKPSPKIGDTRPDPRNPFYKQTVTGYDIHGPVWRSRDSKVESR